MKLFKSFCKKELINRGVVLRNQKIAYSKKDFETFKYFIFSLKLKIIFKGIFKNCGKLFFQNCNKRVKISQRIQLIGNIFKKLLKTQKLEKLNVIKVLINNNTYFKKSNNFILVCFLISFRYYFEK